ncbi:hypothetical protein A2335_02195 [Candidatus Peregrinibacteria bacterium RIFOXYB2_FULL_32_7]|nr:MAG: hypothetical protein A2335_02195 [Candidatus Peregrinibacteria bacterium RIFOXYB2_FULL_32_7]
MIGNQQITDIIQIFLSNLKTTENLNEPEIKFELQKIINQKNSHLSQKQNDILMQKILDQLLGLGVLEEFLRDDEISEIMVNGKDKIFIEKNGCIEKTNLIFQSDDELLKIIQKIVSKVGRRIDASSPMVDARLHDGSRINAIIEPLSLIGPVLTIRKFPKEIFTFDKLIEFETANLEIKTFLEKAVSEKQNILISGGTGSGKTSTLNALSNFIPENERIITIEDSAEIKINHPHLIQLEARPPNIEGKGEITIRNLVKNALRMRPDRIIIGEVRGAEALDMLQAMNTGHKGSLTTIHANSALEALYRLETMTLMSDVKLPLNVIRTQIIQGLDLIIQQQRFSNGKRKIISISKIDKNEKDYKLIHY